MPVSVPFTNVINLELKAKRNSMTPNNSLLYNFETRELEQDTVTRVSLWGLSSVNQVLEKIKTDHNVTKSEYLLGPLYKDHSDLQVGITGKIKYGETDKSAALREIEEEIGYRIDDKDLAHVGTTMEGKEVWNVYSANVINLKPLIRSATLVEGKDNFTKRVLILLHGSKPQMVDLFSKEFNMRKSDEKTWIKGIGMITVDTLSKVVTTPREGKKIGYYDITFL